MIPGRQVINTAAGVVGNRTQVLHRNVSRLTVKTSWGNVLLKKYCCHSYFSCPQDACVNGKRTVLPMTNFPTFPFRIPFTIQRLCELLTEPKRNYTGIDKFLRGVEKVSSRQCALLFRFVALLFEVVNMIPSFTGFLFSSRM